MTPRLPDAKFFLQAEDNGWTLVQIRYSRGGGGLTYELVRNASQLAELVCSLPPQAAVAILSVGKHLAWEDAVYVADTDGTCRPGAY
jgi:hypothetical protein